jgi:hypothetical protein
MAGETGPEARVLITGPITREQAAACSARFSGGSIIVLAGGQDELPRLRRIYAEWENIMASPGSREDIPWAEGRFTLIVDEAPDRPAAEMIRVLAPGGRMSAIEDVIDDA